MRSIVPEMQPSRDCMTRSSMSAGLRGFSCDFLPLECAQDSEDFVQIRLLAEVIYLAKNDRPFLVDDKDCAFGYAGNWRTEAQDAVAFGDAAMRKEVAAQWKAQYPGFLLLKGYMASDRVHAYAQNLGIVLGELVYTSIGRRELCRSNRRPIGHVKSKHYVFFPAVIF